jgi:hypothetical protein
MGFGAVGRCFSPEDGYSIALRNVGMNLQVCMAPNPARLSSALIKFHFIVLAIVPVDRVFLVRNVVTMKNCSKILTEKINYHFLRDDRKWLTT